MLLLLFHCGKNIYSIYCNLMLSMCESLYVICHHGQWIAMPWNWDVDLITHSQRVNLEMKPPPPPQNQILPHDWSNQPNEIIYFILKSWFSWFLADSPWSNCHHTDMNNINNNKIRKQSHFFPRVIHIFLDLVKTLTNVFISNTENFFKLCVCV